MNHSVCIRGRVKLTVVVVLADRTLYVYYYYYRRRPLYTPTNRSRRPSQRQPPGRTYVQYPRG